ncbi:dynein beta chain, ciliary-like isoform X2 [Bombus huntii]|uniref:dynein beta chain, ciliary-like isoform X2 n=1 Tax=Bombus huntii TaxID=85661 RepID=UPI0021AA075F|nr:dynein beta chain, ciliary-like isoform X2 [Bombus huntii]
MEDFQNLEKDIEGAAKRWKKFVESDTPERESFPQDWKNKTALQRLCIMRCLRLDRMTYAIRLMSASSAIYVQHTIIITCFGRNDSFSICLRVSLVSNHCPDCVRLPSTKIAS